MVQGNSAIAALHAEGLSLCVPKLFLKKLLTNKTKYDILYLHIFTARKVNVYLQPDRI